MLQHNETAQLISDQIARLTDNCGSYHYIVYLDGFGLVLSHKPVGRVVKELPWYAS